MKNVTMIDMTAMVALKSIIDNFKNRKKNLVFCGINNRILKKLEKANFKFNEEYENFSSLDDAITFAKLL
jgi:SulP family sulfate permease